MADWNKIKTEYITKGTSYRKLAQKYGVGESTLFARASKERWVEQKEQHQRKTVAKTIDAISDKQAERAAKVLEAADLLLDKVIQRIKAVDALEMGSQEYRHLSSTIKDCRDTYMIRSDADMREQEARIANLRKQAEKEEVNRDVTITIEGGDPSWQS